MSDRNLRLQVVLNAVDKLTRPFKDARAGSQELAAAIKKSRDALKQFDQAGAKLDGFRTLQQSVKQTGADLAQARLRAQMMTREMAGMENPTKKQTKALEDQWRAVSRLEKKQQEETAQLSRVRAELYRLGISAKDGTGATEKIRRETARYNNELREQEARLKRVGEQQRRAAAARAQYTRSLEIRDRVAGAGAAMTAAGVGMSAPVLSAVKSYSSLEDAMKGVAKQVNGLRDDNGNRTAQFYEMQAAIKQAGEQLPMANGAIDYAALVEGGARMGIGGDAKTWEEQKADLLRFAAVSAKAATAFELPADTLAEDLGKIAQLYKVPTKNIEQLGDALNYLDDNAMSKGADIIDVMKRMGDTANRLDYKKAAALGSTFLSLGSAPEVAASAAKAMVRELSVASIQSDRYQEGLKRLNLDPFELQKAMVTDSMGTIMRVLEQVNKLKPEDQTPLLTMLFGKEFGDDATKLANNLPELRRQLALTQGKGALGSMQKESDINKDSLSAQWMLVKTGAANAMSSLGETLRGPLLEIMGYIKKVTGGIRSWVENNPKLAGTIMKVVAAVAAITTVFGALGLAAAAILGPLAIMRFGFSFLSGGALSRLLPGFGGLAAIIARLAPGLAGAGGGIRALLASLQNTDAASVLERIREALSGFGGDDEEGGILDALRNGVLKHLKEQAENAGGALVAAFRNPVATLSALRGHVAGLATAGFGMLGTAVSRFGNILLALVTSPLALLRTALMATGGLLGALLSPVGLVVMALSAVALVVWKYWQPITAFLSGMVEGFQAAAGPVKEAFEPVRPVFTWIADKVAALWKGFTDLLAPVKSSAEELNHAADMGKRFGQMLADGLAMVMSPLESLKSGVSWLLEKLGIVNKESQKLPDARTVTGNSYSAYGTAAASGYGGGYNLPMYDSGGFLPAGKTGIVGENGPELINGPVNIMSRRRTAALAAATAMAFGSLSQPVAAKPLHPLSLPVTEYRQPSAGLRGGDLPVSSGPAKYEINIHQAPGQSAQDVVAEVMRQLDARERQRAAGRRSSFSDRGDFEP